MRPSGLMLLSFVSSGMCRNYMNDSLRTDIFVRYSPETIACACIYLSARLLQIALPNNPPWFAVFGVTEEDIQDTCRRVLSIYNRKVSQLAFLGCQSLKQPRRRFSTFKGEDCHAMISFI